MSTPTEAFSAGFSPTLKRHCSISPAGLLRVFVALGAVSIAIGAGFAVAGAWLILPFAGLEVVALGVAFVTYARRMGQQLEAARLPKRD